MKRTSPAKNRLKANVIKNKFQEDPSMRLPSRLIWRFCRHFLKLILSNHLSNLLPTLISRIFSTTFQNKQTQIFFCQIIMGSPLNSNVPEGRSVHLYDYCFLFQFCLELMGTDTCEPPPPWCWLGPTLDEGVPATLAVCVVTAFSTSLARFLE